MVYVITGGPGFGKTTLINLLSTLNFPVGREAARELLFSSGSENEPDTVFHFPGDFERKIAMDRLHFLLETAPDSIAFADRGLPDQIAYSWYKKNDPSPFIEEIVKTNKYAPYVFITPPWKEIYRKDQVRKENFEEALAIHDQIVRAYLKYGYKIVNLPLVNPESRVQFILNFLDI
jgi:predicted ATPase